MLAASVSGGFNAIVLWGKIPADRAATDVQLKQVYENLASRLGTKKVKREISDVFAGGAALLLLAGGALSALWFRRVP